METENNTSLTDGFRIIIEALKLNDIDNDKLWRVLYMRGICFERIDQWEKAEKDFLNALEVDPNLPQVLNYLAYGWVERDIFIDRSLEMLTKAFQQDPDNHYILDSLASNVFIYTSSPCNYFIYRLWYCKVPS